MSDTERVAITEALKELPEEDKRFVLCYAAGVVAAKQPKEDQPSGDGNQSPRWRIPEVYS